MNYETVFFSSVADLPSTFIDECLSFQESDRRIHPDHGWEGGIIGSQSWGRSVARLWQEYILSCSLDFICETSMSGLEVQNHETAYPELINLRMNESLTDDFQMGDYLIWQGAYKSSSRFKTFIEMRGDSLSLAIYSCIIDDSSISF